MMDKLQTGASSNTYQMLLMLVAKLWPLKARFSNPVRALVTIAVAAQLCLSTTAVQSSDEPQDDPEQLEEGNISDSLVDPLNPFGDQDNTSVSNNSETCQIVIINPGSIRPNIENNLLSSKELGGRAGALQVTATSNSYALSIDAPLGFTAMPTGGARDVSMSTSFSGTGATNFSETPGQNPVSLRSGATLVEAHLMAKRPLSNPFPSGQYSAEITVRCE